MQKHPREAQAGEATVGRIRAILILQLESLAVHVVRRPRM